uniref:Unconventional myosin-VIIa-like n=1 Tax=Mastacembelus armatus TaxID=205130 RepID=A0A3Q3N3P0_9TELE
MYVLCFQGEWVWVDSPIGVPIGARVKVTPSGQRLLVDDEGKEQSLSPEQEASLRIMHPTSVEGVDDMIKLGDLNEAGLLRNLLLRHKQGIIYTYTELGELPPHIFAIAESCYFNMKRHSRNQCCIISGESGAGKTESTKLILQYLAAVSGELSEQQIEQQLLESNPILEAFGNAKTIRNDNSSRFGKYLEIFFNKDGVIEGARVEQYLLEKSRVCHQALQERNYHIFYCMLAGITAEEKRTLSLGNAKEYKFLTKGDCIMCESRDDAKDYNRVCSGMKILTFSENQCQEILELLAAILHLGNVSFNGESTTQNNLETSDVCKSEHFSMAASLLQVGTSSLANSLTHRSFMTNRERVTKPLNSEQASDCRDAFVKAIYNKLFIWIVGKINSVIYKKLTNSSKSRYLSIGLLDIFGFENFNTNSFEQLCINFANEKLQQFFVGHIFKLEQAEYLKEDIVWNNINYNDNQDILDLLAGKPCNLLALIDEESNFPKGSDLTLLNKLNQQHSGNKNYLNSISDRDTEFGIRHFAGLVYYDSKGFLEKNRDAVSFDIIKTVDMSTNKLLRQIFEAELSTSAHRPIMPTLSGQFRQSLDSLMKALSVCQPFFIRCFKPNSDKQSEVFDRELCMRQLRYSGMMDTVRIRKLGYPIRHTFEEFLRRYRVLLKTTICDPKTETAAACCDAICKTVIKGQDEWRIGSTKIFLKDAHDAALEREREHELSRVAVVIQRVMLGHKDRKSFLKKRRAVVVLQKHWRAYREKIVRGYRARKDWKRKREAVMLLQAYTRGLLDRRATQKGLNTFCTHCIFLALSSLSPTPSQVFISRLEEQNTEQIVLAVQQRLEDVIAQSQQPDKEPEPVIEQDSGENLYDLQQSPAVKVVETETEVAFVTVNSKKFASHTEFLLSLLQACLTISWIILRFMEDIPEPKALDTISEAPSTVSHPLPLRQSRRLSYLVGLDEKILRRNKKKLAGNRKASVIPEEPENVSEDGDILIGEGPTLDRPLSSLEKLHIIVGYALSRKDIRDEIYCQICKQLVNNKNRNSRMLGWTLLSICLGIFPPTDLFMKYLESFICRGPDGYRAYCTERLRRIIANGERKELPCWIELQAAKSKEPIDASVSLMDGRIIEVDLESASTSAEVCQTVADRIDLKDTYGFSLYIRLYDKMWSLGSCGKHVLDAVSQCEQEMRRQGKKEKDTPWSLSIRKEVFTPWHDCSVDPISTDLIYRQVIKGIKSGEYTSDKEDDYVQLAAKHYYIQFGAAHSKDNIQKVVEECIATQRIESKSMTKWIELISSAHLQGPYISGKQSTERVKGELVSNAQQKWPLHFSKFYEVTLMSGPSLPKSRFVVAVNWSGIFFIDERDKRLLELSYLEVKDWHVRLPTHRKKNNSYQTYNKTFMHLSSSPDDPMFLVCKRGDLLLTEKYKDFSPEEKLIKATNQRTGNTGAVSKETVQFLPTLNKPTDEVLDLLNSQQRKISATQSSSQRDETVAPVSLKEFALENFRAAGKEVGHQGASKGAARDKLWACSKEPLKQPLMKSLVRNSELSYLACSAFTDILEITYMGDYPIKQVRSALELTDQIFGPATQHEALQDEIYCQIMRQMTSNNNRLSLERGWQLMWLCSGLFRPSQNLMRHTQRFLESRPRDLLAAGCLQRLQAMCSKEPRKLPPHLVEVDAIQQNSTQIFHKVHFPNDTTEIVEVTSTTTIRDLCCSVASELKLSSADGYGLYLKTPNKVSLDEQKYFFDSLRQTSDFPKKARRASMPYLVIFKRKLWFNVIPGKDWVADLIFHFPQELPKYLRGYHSCTKDDLITLGGLLFRAKVDSDRSQFVMIPKMLNDLVPADQIKIMSSEEWKKHIISSYNKQSGLTLQEAKVAFLRAISSWPTFGCAFFEVKQTCESSYPSKVLIAISKQGVSLIDPVTKGVLVMHPFSRITEYHSRRSFFQMTIGTLVRGNNFVCETSQAYTMEDLLRSYVTMYERQRQAFRPRNHMFS